MTFRLSANNVFAHLQSTGLCSESELSASQVELKPAKNFNLLVSLPTGRKLLVKQERYIQTDKPLGEFFNEWRIRQFWHTFPELTEASSTVSQLLHFDRDRAIAVFEYLDDYRDLADFYSQEKQYPEHVASALGQILAAMHQATFQKANYETFLLEKLTAKTFPQAALTGLEHPGPEVFGSMPGDGLRFLVLYQRFESLAEAIAATQAQLTPSCLTHNDLKLNNVLLCSEPLQTDSERIAKQPELIRLIDWERANWGDPAFDLGTLIASYLQLWLGSLIVSQDISIEESLRLAIVPLEKLQPSLCALVEAYFNQFPEVLAQRPDFLILTLKLAGIALIQQIQSFLQHQKSFGNNQICILQVAKSLLCQPEAAIPILFGTPDLSISVPCVV